MIKRFLLSAFFILFFIVTIFGFFIINNHGQVNTYAQEKVVYELPYPGILPDHPLYLIKMIRDRLIDFLTRDSLKKAKLYLLYSDKRVSTALMLENKGKYKLAITTLAKGEKYFLKIPDLILQAKKQGLSSGSEFIDQLKNSNKKHREVINNLLKTTPKDQQSIMMEIIKINQKIEEKLNNL